MKKIVSILMVLVILALGTTVIAGAASSAVVSPTKEDVWHISTKTVGDGDADSDKYSVVKNSDDTVTLTATDGTESFYKWTMEGQYTIIDGGLDGRVMTIMPASDIVATAYFSGGSSSTTSSSTTSSGSTSSTSSGTNSSSTSPKTGSFTYAMILTLIALAAGGVAIVVSKKVRQK